MCEKNNQNAVLSDIREIVTNGQSFVIVGHADPDGDAVGACYGMGMALKKLGKQVSVVLERYHDKYDIIPGREMLSGEVPDEAEILLCLDCAAPDRLGKAEVLLKKANVTVCIDHHISNPGFGDCNYIEAGASSTCEIVYRLLEGMLPLDKDIASALYGGIVYDTGGFRHSSTTAETLRVASRLVETDIPFTLIYNTMLHRHTLSETKIFSKALTRLRVIGHVGYAYLTLADFRENGTTAGGVDGIGDYILNTCGVEAAAFFYEKSAKTVKVSLRSKSEAESEQTNHCLLRTRDVGAVASRYGGGGHTNAAGCTMAAGLEEAINTIMKELSGDESTGYFESL